MSAKMEMADVGVVLVQTFDYQILDPSSSAGFFGAQGCRVSLGFFFQLLHGKNVAISSYFTSMSSCWHQYCSRHWVMCRVCVTANPEWPERRTAGDADNHGVL